MNQTDLIVPLSTGKWIHEAECRSSEVDMLKTRITDDQYDVCNRCVVFSECRAELLSINPDEIVGVWAGLNNKDWRALRSG